MVAARVELPPKLVPVFVGEADYRGAYGGRGSGKTATFALMSAVRGYAAGQGGNHGMLLCGREFMNSLEDSSFREVEAAILTRDDRGEYKYPWLAAYYEIGRNYIRSRDGRISFGFCGLRHNLDSVKGKFRILIAWVDEAEAVSDMAWDKLDATIRADGSELWVTWNPESEDSATRKRYCLNPPPRSKIVELNWRDNPWFPERLDRIRRRKMEADPDRYAWEWEGQCLTMSDAQILSGKWAIDEFTPSPDWDGPYYGLDWGFATDPTVAVKCWSHGGDLYIEHEAGMVGLELDDTVAYLSPRLPGLTGHTVRADCSRPESISYVRRNGLPRCVPVRKWAGSVEDGIQHLRSYRRIVVHPRCAEVARECRLYSYKVDRLSGDVLPVPVDANNHYIDAIRYALEPLIGSGLETRRTTRPAPDRPVDAWGRRTEGNDTWKTL